jgi:hypothetical protein
VRKFLDLFSMYEALDSLERRASVLVLSDWCSSGSMPIEVCMCENLDMDCLSDYVLGLSGH